eukprot:TRINITY_DN72281_c0_g1_i1.p1 TRINITY_DN72281_c0_g1~~TRINITY_DN72281_c0_g1_i1.p1  ORF type:complete len:466 (+),score=61.02 TRINITY_DN72281_c0_g1_i1:50-1447(+)
MAKHVWLLSVVWLQMPAECSKMKKGESDHLEELLFQSGLAETPVTEPRSVPMPQAKARRDGAWSLAPHAEIEGVTLAEDGMHVAHPARLANDAHSFLGSAKKTQLPHTTQTETDWQDELRRFRRGEPLISVVVPTSADREQYFESALSNFLRQDYPNKELVVLSSQPADETGGGEGGQVMFWRDAAAKYDNIRYEHLNSTNAAAVSIGAKRNALLEKSKGLYIATFDDDDLYHEQYLSRMTEQLLLHRADLVKPGRFDAFVYFHSKNHGGSSRGMFLQSDVAKRGLAHEMFGYGFLYVFRRAAFHSLGCRYPATSFGEDWGYAHQIALKGGKVVMLSHSPFPGIVVKVQHGHQTSNLINVGKSSLGESEKHAIAARFADTHHLRHVSITAIAASKQCKYRRETDTVSGRYLFQADLSTEEECCGLCRAYPSCFGFVFSRQGCYLKSVRQIGGGTRHAHGVWLGTK